MSAVYANIHDRARALSHSKGISLTAAYAELSRRSSATRKALAARRKRNLGKMEVTAADFSGVSGVDSSCQRQWLPYVD